MTRMANRYTEANRYTDAISQNLADLAEVRTACEHLAYSYDGALANPIWTVFHLYHCAMVYRLRDGLTPTQAAELAWRKNILGVKEA